MTRNAIVLAALAIVGPLQACGAKPVELKDDQSRASYAIGVNLGTNLKRDGIAVDPALLAQGIRDAMSGKPALTDAQVGEVLAQLQPAVVARRAAALAQSASENQAAGIAFLKANAAKRGVVSLPSGMQYQVLKAGTGPKPKLTDTVRVHYRGTLLDGTEFDSSYGRGEPASLEVGGVIKGWTEALQLMPVGSKWRLFVPAELAYGAEGGGDAIPPNATLIFEVELLSIQG